MAGRVIDYFGRPTTLIGAAAGRDFFSPAVDATSYKTLYTQVNAETIATTAGTAALKAQMQQSFDGLTYANIGSEETIVEGTPTNITSGPTASLVRLRVNLSSSGGGVPMVTLWARGLGREA
jgi:hypothetical protein